MKKRTLFSLASILGISSILGCGGKEFSLMTYNIGGLPAEVSKINPAENIPKISPLLNEYDIVLVQENFLPKYGLSSETKHPFIFPEEARTGEEGTGNPSGLSTFSIFEIDDYGGKKLPCNGILEDDSDCLARKGYSIASYMIPLTENEADSGNNDSTNENNNGTTAAIKIINVHLDSGDSPGDIQARTAALDILVKTINGLGHYAVIVAGDFNLGEKYRNQYDDFLTMTNLTDVCRQLGCEDDNRIDKITYRSGTFVELEAVDYYLPSTFKDEKGKDLSDHLPVAADFAISVKINNY